MYLFIWNFRKAKRDRLENSSSGRNCVKPRQSAQLFSLYSSLEFLLAFLDSYRIVTIYYKRAFNCYAVIGQNYIKEVGQNRFQPG